VQNANIQYVRKVHILDSSQSILFEEDDNIYKQSLLKSAPTSKQCSVDSSSENEHLTAKIEE